MQHPPPPPDGRLGETLILVNGAQRADPRSWHSLDARLRPWLVSQLRSRRLPRGLDPDDIVQEVMVYVVGHVHSFRVEPSAAFRAWVLRVMTSKLADAWRRATTQKRAEHEESLLGDLEETLGNDPVADPAAARPDLTVERNELLQGIDRAMKSLSPEHAEVIRLREENDLPFEDIARELGYRHAEAARGLYRRAKLKRRELLRNLAPDDAAEETGAPD